MASRIVLHVGTPKTGTSAAQDVLFAHRDELRGQGILYPADRFDAHFLAALDLMSLPWGGLEHEATGRWDQLAAQVREWPGTAIISHEILGRATRQQARRALESLGEAEVHVVLSARDLVRQIPAEWQESVKHRRTMTWADFLANLQEPRRSAEVAQWFWGVQELPDILDRWAGDLPPEQVHVVTVPPAGAPHELLWQRLSSVLGVDGERFRPTGERANVSLGVAESNLIRRLNKEVNLDLPPVHYRQFVRELIVHQHLAKERGSARLTVPPEVHRWATTLAESWVAELTARGYQVTGDLAELVPAAPTTSYVDPDHAPADQVADAAIRALGVSVLENARLREVEIELHGVLDDMERQLQRAYSTPVYKVRKRIYEAAKGSSAVRAALDSYRRRGRNSRST